ncbi:hypothetical protein PG995_006564 [Apiospora arundinis]|uniref:Uncharacterized protein n=1 Tax=Apiospora arundinis TaxID=335852 RepID=A0ABR2JJZ3_9PEZI
MTMRARELTETSPSLPAVAQDNYDA